MSEKDQATPSSQNDGNPRFLIKGQYIKDLSFENPRAPQSLLTWSDKPKIDVNVDINAQRLNESGYEMVLHITVKATSENETLFLADLAYAGIFVIEGIPEDRMEQMLLIECPFVLFPFARRVMADITRDGGFPPLMLDPIDFHAMYVQQKAARANAKKAG